MTKSIPLALASVLALALPASAMAQSLDYGSVDGGGDAPSAGKHGERGGKDRGGRGGKRDYGVSVSPYIEAAQIVTAELEPGDEVLTYSRLTAGVDAGVSGRHNAASVSVRYDRYFGWGKRASDGDVISGVASGYATVTPGLQVEAGALATRSKINGDGTVGGIGSIGGGGANSGNVYSVYAGPTIKTRAGVAEIDANYRIGYTKVDSSDAIALTPGGPAVDVFDESVVQQANIHAGVAPGEVLPVGLGVGGGYYQEDVSNLDQRVRDLHARADVTLPVGQDIALVGGVGYEEVEISSRDALRDANGLPVIGSDGRYVTDKSAPRQLAYDVSGIIWDAGVVWKPSKRTQLEAHVGKRYGTTTYYGTFAYAPSARSSINVSVYDGVTGFGGQVNRVLADLPADFEAVRNPLTGDLNGCVASMEGNNCLSGVLGSVRSSTFRARGVAASYNLDLGRISAGLGAGYDRRKFIAARGTILAASNGVIDENIWLAAYMNAKLSERGTLSTNAYANWTKSGDVIGGKITSLGATAAYGHTITNHLSATVAVGIDGTTRQDPLPDDWEASALAGVRYRF